ncbi:F204A-like protein [Mya arenaria]|uniref:F204A-like protein n=1 Tax=Mya arenaria TaxID=6604 RepID=A0ABY7FI53_MYAAR|nr:protein FAM204A-like [Mya arenaria]XP_052771835.1 protein FAM204A-like [Mya arenaria]XP_052771836.1 protein FAM204A-like [Mya arenaria]XP_052771837.1 protein FAM204A-like [Mya arenaria]XP_052771838.1 protein FAM204A-like [Mya arenaria]XP_052771839.1 protein FAM204A-like [Mya arenaria]WAR21853.1 F204A-like protein [Mya arenaria]
MDSISSTTKEPIKPKSVSAKLWERFQALESRTNEVTRRSTEKRIKHLKKNILDTVQQKLSSEEEKDILKQHKVDLGTESCDNEKQITPQTTVPRNVEAETSCSQTDSAERLKELDSYLGVNDHLHQGSSLAGQGESGLEKQIEEALKQGDVKSAEEMSDRLATRKFGVRIHEAVEARDYTKRKQAEEAEVKAKKRKTLHWGFGHKQRWETKSNM